MVPVTLIPFYYKDIKLMKLLLNSVNNSLTLVGYEPVFGKVKL